jgi:hypothetical protein
LNGIIASQSDVFVWPFSKGTARGQSIIPLYKTVPAASQMDSELYELLALSDAVRVGNAREVKLAIEELRKRFIAVRDNSVTAIFHKVYNTI